MNIGVARINQGVYNLQYHTTIFTGRHCQKKQKRLLNPRNSFLAGTETLKIRHKKLASLIIYYIIAREVHLINMLIDTGIEWTVSKMSKKKKTDPLK